MGSHQDLPAGDKNNCPLAASSPPRAVVGMAPSPCSDARSRLTRLAGPWRQYSGCSFCDRCASGSARTGQDRVAVLGAHGRPDWPGVTGRSDARQFDHGRERWVARHDTRRRWSADVADEVTEAGVVVHEQDPRLALTDHSERVRHAAGMETQCPAPTTTSSSPQRTTIWPPRMYQMSSRLSWTCRGGAELVLPRFADITVSTEPGQAHTVAVFQIEPSVLVPKPVAGTDRSANQHMTTLSTGQSWVGRCATPTPY